MSTPPPPLSAAALLALRRDDLTGHGREGLRLAFAELAQHEAVVLEPRGRVRRGPQPPPADPMLTTLHALLGRRAKPVYKVVSRISWRHHSLNAWFVRQAGLALAARGLTEAPSRPRFGLFPETALARTPEGERQRVELELRLARRRAGEVPAAVLGAEALLVADLEALLPLLVLNPPTPHGGTPHSGHDSSGWWGGGDWGGFGGGGGGGGGGDGGGGGG